MPHVPIEKVIDKANFSVYKLVMVASKRALEISEGSTILVDDKLELTKATTIALEEIAAGKVWLKQPK